jgi:outer membrane biosynthesis protein TonB
VLVAGSARSASPARTETQEVLGSLEKAQIREAIHQQRDGFQGCFEAALARAPGIHGEIAVKFVIEATGAVSKAGIAHSDVGDIDFEGCVAGVVRTLGFPKPKGGGVVIVTYPFLFKTSGASPAPEATGQEAAEVLSATPKATGGLSKDVIASVIKRHEEEIRYCYEVELNSKPALTGQVTVAFVVRSTGEVDPSARITGTTLGDSNVESCMLKRIQRWTFPKPEGGGVVNITYPWIFKPANSP